MKKIMSLFFAVLTITIFSSTTSLAAEMSKSEMLSKVYELSNKALNVSKMAAGKLEDPRLKDLNQQILSNQSLSSGALQQIASQMGVNLPTTDKSAEGGVLEKLKGLKGKAFEKEYLNTETGLHTQLLDLVKNKLLPTVNSPITRTLLQSYSPKLSAIVESAKSLNL